MTPGPIDRRRFLLGSTAAVVGPTLLAACSGDDESATGAADTAVDPSTSTTAPTSATTATTPVVCELTPEQIEGPYYLDLDLVRSDITEGKPGVPLALTITAVDTTRCAAMADLPVDIWHCDAAGVYSGFEGQRSIAPGRAEPVDDQRFLRGTQLTDGDGRCTFRTIVPGWYPGRAVHIHVKAHPTDTSEAVTQLYFGDDVLEEVHATEPYTGRDGTFISWADDSLRPGPELVLDLEPEGDGYRADFTVGIATS